MNKELFSPTENKLLKILGKKRMSITEISDVIYKDEKKKPMNSSIIISGLISRINKKADFHDLNWHLNGEGRGRAGRTVWLDKN